MKLIQEAIEAAATQDLCGNHNSADLLRRLAGYLTDEIAMSGALAGCLSGETDLQFRQVSMCVLAAHAKRREARE